MFAIQCAKHFAKSLFPAAASNNLTLRFASKTTKDCTPPAPRCGTEMIKKLVADGCRKPVKKANFELKPPPFKSMWENPECCNLACPDLMPRFDELYYQPSDKSKKVYRQTWVECPEKKIVRKAVCDYKNLKYPKMEKRSRKARPKTACALSHTKMQCMQKANHKCPKICLPGCKGARSPPKCLITRGPSKCKKICTPYPSFSECKKPKPKPRRKIECNCLRLVSKCEAYEVLRRISKIKGGYTKL